MWMARDLGTQNSGEITYADSSRMDPKRSHQWLTNPAGTELFSNKKRATEGAESRSSVGIPHMNVSAWDNSPSFPSASGQFVDRLFGPEHMETANLIGRDIPSIDGQNTDEGRTLEDRYGNTSSVGLSMSHAVHDTSSCLNFGGIRKVKVNQVQDFNRSMLEPMTHLYSEGVSRSMDIGAEYRSQNNTISLGQTYCSSDKSFMSTGSVFSKTGPNFFQNFIKEGSGLLPLSDIYDKGDGNVLSMCQPFEKGDNLVLMGQSFQKTDSNIFSMSPSYNKGQENFISMVSSYGKAPENLFTIGSSFHKEGANMLSGGPSSNKEVGDMAFMISSQDRAGQNNVSIGHNFDKGGSNTISFGGFQNQTVMLSSGGIVSGYDSIGDVAKTSEEPSFKEIEENTCSKVNSGPTASPRVDAVPKSKTAKKVSPNTFPSNVKSLLTTGMFDGVPVKYYSWSREKNLKGIIKGTGYLCGCSDCNLTKVLNAYEFERHANCKTKHPNNHIYFENGKTIYAVVQELKNTPQEMLFDVIQNVTGSQINQKNFNTWKASYQAATRELQRIYGKDAVTLAS